ncbi:MAG: hypothetical protein K6E47_04805 [Lachnospiraceae bacterium]|nr:hypothetical protein [Lachnospiraceae bacterium]
MKIYHFVIIFVIFSVSMMIMRDVELNIAYNENRELLRDEKIMENATMAAVRELKTAGIRYDNNLGLKAIEAFFYSVFASENCMDDFAKREEIRNGFYMFIISIPQGYHIYTGEWKDNGKGMEYQFSGSELIAYDEGDEVRTAGFSYMTVTKEGEERVLRSAGVTVNEIPTYVVDRNGLYHEEDCGFISETDVILFSKEGCARFGARPCDKCIDK